ncbi:centromere protein S [Podospora conica]|nr:centromere protein S [Schizothecium conicum]
MPPSPDQQELRERLKEALWFSIGKIVDDESLRWNRNATPQFIGALTDVVWAQIEHVAIDLENFAHHAGRTTVSTDDVLLLARRNTDLHGMIKEVVDKQVAAKMKNGKGGKGRVRGG